MQQIYSRTPMPKCDSIKLHALIIEAFCNFLIIIRGVFRTQSNISDVAFCKNSWRLSAVNWNHGIRSLKIQCWNLWKYHNGHANNLFVFLFRVWNFSFSKTITYKSICSIQNQFIFKFEYVSLADPSRNSDSNEFGHLKINERSKLTTLV